MTLETPISFLEKQKHAVFPEGFLQAWLTGFAEEPGHPHIQRAKKMGESYTPWSDIPKKNIRCLSDFIVSHQKKSSRKNISLHHKPIQNSWSIIMCPSLSHSKKAMFCRLVFEVLQVPRETPHTHPTSSIKYPIPRTY